MAAVAGNPAAALVAAIDNRRVVTVKAGVTANIATIVDGVLTSIAFVALAAMAVAVLLINCVALLVIFVAAGISRLLPAKTRKPHTR
jgi:hypothetical protein